MNAQQKTPTETNRKNKQNVTHTLAYTNKKSMKMYLTEQDAVYGLHRNGYTHDFQIAGADLLWIEEKVFVRAGDFVIDECHQFTDHSRKGEDIIVLGVVALSHNIKGILIRHDHKILLQQK